MSYFPPKSIYQHTGSSRPYHEDHHWIPSTSQGQGCTINLSFHIWVSGKKYFCVAVVMHATGLCHNLVCSHAKLYASHMPFSIESHAYTENGAVLEHTLRLPTIRVFDFTSHASVKGSNWYETFQKYAGYMVDVIVVGSNKYVTLHKHGRCESQMQMEESSLRVNLKKCEEFQK